MWMRVFGLGEREPRPAELLECLNAHGLPVIGHFRGDDLGWTSAELVLAANQTPIYLERFLPQADDIRGELNAWAAWLETADYNPNHTSLMERIIQTRQLFTVRRPLDHADEIQLDRVCDQVCRFLAEHCDGVYQIDGQGFFNADGALVLEEY